jgi:hypothetical protein
MKIADGDAPTLIAEDFPGDEEAGGYASQRLRAFQNALAIEGWREDKRICHLTADGNP